jgi:hypothetical protein
MKLWMGLSMAAMLVLHGCGRDGIGLTVGEQLRIEPASRSVFLDQVFDFTVVLDSPDGTIDVTNDPGLVLRAEPGELLSVSPGRAQARAPGSAILVADLGRLSAQAVVTVLDDRLVGLSVSPGEVQISVGATSQLTVLGELESGATVDLTAGSDGTAYVSSDPGVVDVSGDGLVSGLAAGEATISVSQAGVSAEATVRVLEVADDILAIRISPDPLELQPGETARIEVIGTSFSEGDVILPASEVAFSVAEPDVVTLDPSGLVTAGGEPGETTIRAEFEGLLAEATVVVGPERRLLSLAIDPPSVTLAVGPDAAVQVRVRAVFSDGAIEDVTDDPRTTYTADDDRIEVIQGQVTGLQPGGSGFTVRFEGLQSTVSVTVLGEVTVTELLVFPDPFAVRVGERAPVVITAAFSDGSQQNVTAQATFNPPPDGALSFDGSSLFGVSEGLGVASFSFQGQEAEFRYAVVADFDAIEVFIDPDPLLVDEGQSLSFSLFARLSDGTLVDVTTLPEVTYTSSNPNLFTVSPGTVNGVSAGSGVLVANAFGLLAQASVTVQAMVQLTGIEISVSPVIPAGQDFPVQVLGTFSDGTVTVLNGDPNLSLIAAPASILLLSGTTDLTITGLAAGTGVLTATFQGFVDTQSIQVTPAANPVIALRFSPPVLQLPVNDSSLVTVFALRADNTETQLTLGDGLVLVPGPGVSVTPQGNQFVVQGLVTGSSQVVGLFSGLTAVLPVEVLEPMDPVVGIRLEVPPVLQPGEVGTARVFALTQLGSEFEVTQDGQTTIASATPAILDVVGSDIIALAPGTGVVTASFQAFVATETVSVQAVRIPTLVQLLPDVKSVNDPDRSLIVVGNDLLPGDQILIGGMLQTVSASVPGQITVQIDPGLLASSGTLVVQAQSPAGLSNPLSLEVVDPPQVDRFYPNRVPNGSTVRFRAFGSGFLNATVSGPMDIVVQNIQVSADQDELTFEAVIPVGRTGVMFFVIDAAGGSAPGPFALILPPQNLTANTGTNFVPNNNALVIDDLTVAAAATLAPNLRTNPLVLLVTGDADIDGIIDVSGTSGGLAGAGAGGGGGGGDGGSTVVGGTGAPSGQNSNPPVGPGTGGGDGGGVGAGAGAPNNRNCGGGGGGGASANSGGSGSDAPGGSAPGRSDWFTGTGGGGGNACGSGAAGRAGRGGGGGGLIEIQLVRGGDLDVAGIIDARGGDGEDGFGASGGGGGGGGGVIRLITVGGILRVNASGLLVVEGGDGGRGGGLNNDGGGGSGGTIFSDDGPGTTRISPSARLVSGGTGFQGGGTGSVIAVP